MIRSHGSPKLGLTRETIRVMSIRSKIRTGLVGGLGAPKPTRTAQPTVVLCDSAKALCESASPPCGTVLPP